MLDKLVPFRLKRLFGYDNLDGSHIEPKVATNGSVVTIGASRCQNSLSKKPFRCRNLIIGSIIVGLSVILIIIFSTLTKERHNFEAVTFSKSSNLERVSNSNRSGRINITFDDVLNPQFSSRSFNGTWISDHEFLYMQRSGYVKIFDVISRRSSIVISVFYLYYFSITSWKMSADGKYLLAQKERHKVWRRSSFSEYMIFPLTKERSISMTFKKLIPFEFAASKNKHFYIRYVSWAPVDNGLTYVDYDNDIYFRSNALGRDIKLTNSGLYRMVFNGIPDWVFEEEVFEDHSAIWWSPDGSSLAWGTFNDTDVRMYFMPKYGETLQYPEIDEIHYPKVGTRNPSVQLWVVDLRQKYIHPRLVTPPKPIVMKGEVHFSRVTWIRNDTFAVLWFNRVQNKTVITRCNTAIICHEIFSYEQTNGWIDYKYEVFFEPSTTTEDTPDFVTILPDEINSYYKYPQLVRVTQNGTKLEQITNQASEVTKIIRWSKDGYVYYTATLPGRPGSRHLYRVKVTKMTAAPWYPECLSCKNSQMLYLKRPACQYVGVTLSRSDTYFSLDCYGPGVPWTCIHKTFDNKMVIVLEDNALLSEQLDRMNVPLIRNLQVESVLQGTSKVMMYLPSDFNSSKKYPLLIEVYGGPESQLVDEKYKLNSWGAYMASSEGVIYAMVDTIGSSYQGNTWRHSLYKRFGTIEVDNLMDILHQLQVKFHYIDASKCGIWGWSYGGFVSVAALSRNSEATFACGVAVAPVTNFTLYDTFYTERYMGLLNENPSGYEKATVLRPEQLENLRNKQFFLAQGTHDDNVHFQNSMMLSAALEKLDILFRQHSYPDQSHSITKYYRHLMHSISQFFVKDCFS